MILRRSEVQYVACEPRLIQVHLSFRKKLLLFWISAKYFTLVFHAAMVGYWRRKLFWQAKKNNLISHSKWVFLLTSVDFGSRSETSKMNVNQVRACVADFQTVEYRLKMRSMTYKKALINLHLKACKPFPRQAWILISQVFLRIH